jgi:DNA excision repair protein ERCC-3
VTDEPDPDSDPDPDPDSETAGDPTDANAHEASGAPDTAGTDETSEIAATADAAGSADVSEDGASADDGDGALNQDNEADEDNDDAGIGIDDFYDALEALGRPVTTASGLARALSCTQAEASRALDALAAEGTIERAAVANDPVVWYPTDWSRIADRERVVLFPDRREIVADSPSQFTRAQLSTFAHLVTTTEFESYLYEVRREDVWHAPHDSLDELLRTTRQVLRKHSEPFESWLETQWKRANQFVLRTHAEGYTVLEAKTADLMGNVARQKLTDGQLRATLSDTESWAAEEATAAIKRTLYEAGYPVRDERALDEGEPLSIDLDVPLREYQAHWVREFAEKKAGVFVGPPGSGKTIAALGALADVGGETLILVPSRELAAQWHEEVLTHTSLSPEQVGEYHGGEKQIRPVTIATYQTAGMDRHRQLFDGRRWGLIVYDECQHIPASIYKRTVNLQTRHRLGLSATPIREDDKEEEIYTLIGPPIGADWESLFEAGFVAEPEVEIRYVPWDTDTARNEHASADAGHAKRKLAAMNLAKLTEVRQLRRNHSDAKALVFCEYLDHGEALGEALSAPFVNGSMAHHRRQALFAEFRDGHRDTLVISRVGDEGIDLPNAELAIVASGLGGSRRQGTQRAGRTMRPAGTATMHVLATRGTTEEEFAQRQMHHLAAKGVRVRETNVEGEDAPDAPSSGEE